MRPIRPTRRLRSSRPVFALLVLLACASAGLSAGLSAAEGPPDYQSEVRPILANNCFACHGPDDKARKGRLRLDVREAALAPAKSGERAIVPGDPAASQLIARITAADPDEAMPPEESPKRLSAAQKDVLRRWIAAGADYRPHWAFVPPVQAPLPAVKRADWALGPIDRFVLHRLEAEGLQPSPPAARHALARRVHLDLIGLPPTVEEADAFVADQAPDAYERLVDRLLASPRYGERWARKWLDLARYADTNGYEKDRRRSIWPWRDWVIGALNADLPFDQFTIQQIAGDMLPDATPATITATGFHRNTMLNEEGGIDPQEYRYHAVADRVATTGKTWLGLTIGCAQCHTHKFDPITHREYFSLMAFLDNADEPELALLPADHQERRTRTEARIAELVAALPTRYPDPPELDWTPLTISGVTTASGDAAEAGADHVWTLPGAGAERDTYTLAVDTAGPIDAFRLEALPDPANAHGGPGRSPSGNFVLTTFAALLADADAAPLAFSEASADFSQNSWDVKGAIDADAKSGWGVQQAGRMDLPRSATFILAKPLAAAAHLAIRLDQQYGERHTLRRFRLSAGRRRAPSTPEQRQQRVDAAFAAWSAREKALAVPWTVLRPVAARAEVPILTALDDGSILASGDQTKSDTYEIGLGGDLRGVTALRLEVIPDASLPAGGPGRVYYEGQAGSFSLSEFGASIAGADQPIAQALHSYASGGHTAANAIDGKADTVWSIDGGVGRPHTAVFRFATPLAGGERLDLRLLFERHFAAGLGRFRLSATTAPMPAAASALPDEAAAIARLDEGERSAEQRQRLFREWLLAAPELAAARGEIDNLRRSLREHTTTLVMAERPPQHPRTTLMRERGEWLRPAEAVEPGVPAVLNPLPPGAPRNRLGFARWLVSPDHPLTARVTVNRQWAAFFGRGIVRSIEDFGYQGEMPSHPALLDWLAVEFMRQGWSLKKLHRLIVLSATYRQDSRVSAPLLARDPQNQLLTRGPRLRLEAEIIRDGLLRAAGLLSDKLGGPSVFPPQPASVTTEGAYGALEWKTSEGEDRYRRGLYTFMKRTAPYAMFGTFDAPSGESCIAQREISNSPLQALTLLNDPVVMEAARALGTIATLDASSAGDDRQRAGLLFRRCLTRPPEDQELDMLTAFVTSQRQRLLDGKLDAGALAGAGPGDARERAVWTALARVLLNLDATITKE